MKDAESGLPEIYLRPGEMFLARRPSILGTILGSCVGVSFWSARLGVGALCHSLLPRSPKAFAEDMEFALGPRYVDFCIQSLAWQFDALGVSRSEVRVKVFGGADVLLVPGASKRPTVGKLNSEAAMQVLADEGYAVVASSLRNKFGRKIRFNTENGEVRVLRLV